MSQDSSELAAFLSAEARELDIADEVARYLISNHGFYFPRLLRNKGDEAFLNEALLVAGEGDRIKGECMSLRGKVNAFLIKYENAIVDRDFFYGGCCPQPL
ncbi:MAG: hypothetical protein ABIH34_05275 [Nanoarchaeota archaeon]